MASPFQRYQTGGFEAIPGISQAGANIGQMLGTGMSNFGTSIAGGIKQYYENKSKSAAALQEIEVLGPQLLARRNAYLEASGVDPQTLNMYLQDDPSEGTDDEMHRTLSMNPMIQLAKTLDPAIEALKNAPTKGLSAQLQAVNSAKASMNMIDEQIKMQDFIAKYRIENVNNLLPTAVSEEVTRTTNPALFDPNNPLFKNFADVKKSLEDAYPDNPEFVKAGLDDYVRKAGEKIRADSTVGTPEQRADLINALNRYRDGMVNIEGKNTEFGQTIEDAQKSYEQSMAETIAAEKAMTKQGTNTPTPQRAKLLSDSTKPQSPYVDVEDGLKKLAGKAAEERKKPLQLKEQLNILGSEILSEVTDKHLARIVNGEKVTGWEVLVDITGQDIERNPTSKTVPAGGDDYGWGNSKLPEEYTPARKLMEAAMQKFGINPRKPLTADQFLRLKEAAIAGVQTQKQTATKTAEEVAKITPESVAALATEAAQKVTTPQTPAVKSKPFTVGELNLGTEIVDRTLNAAERESAAREFYAQRFGAVPPGFTQMYRQMYPEATIRTTEVNGIPVMVDGKGNVTPLVSNKEPDVEKQAAAKALTFNNTEIADGVRLTGVFAGTVAGAQAFRKDYSHMANVRSAVDELIKINEMGYETLSPTARARADQLQSEIIAAMRIPIVGPGQVAIPEQQILERIIQRGTGFFTLESGERAALKGLKDRMERELVNWPKSMGLDVKIGGQTSATIKQLRMQKLRTSRNLKPIGEAE